MTSAPASALFDLKIVCALAKSEALLKCSNNQCLLFSFMAGFGGAEIYVTAASSALGLFGPNLKIGT